MCANVFCACRSLLGAAQALEGQGLPVPAAELHSQGVDLATRWEKEEKKTRGSGKANHPHRNVQYAKRIHTRNVYECPRARGRDFFGLSCARSLSHPVLPVMVSSKTLPMSAAMYCTMRVDPAFFELSHVDNGAVSSTTQWVFRSRRYQKPWLRAEQPSAAH